MPLPCTSSHGPATPLRSSPTVSALYLSYGTPPENCYGHKKSSSQGRGRPLTTHYPCSRFCLVRLHESNIISVSNWFVGDKYKLVSPMVVSLSLYFLLLNRGKQMVFHIMIWIFISEPIEFGINYPDIYCFGRSCHIYI